MRDVVVHLRLLGGIELDALDPRASRAILTQRRRLAVLIYLAAAYPPRLHRKDTVRALFWPDADGEHARQALNRAIYVLRQALGSDVVATRGDDEIGAGPALACDVGGFHRALDDGEPEAALALYRGDLAPGYFVPGAPDFERWVESERARLRARAVDAAAALADAAAGRSDLETAVRWAQRAEELSPYDERAATRRMALLDRMGDRAAALGVFGALDARLREELEVEPSPETLALAEAIRARRAQRPAGAVPAVAPPAGQEPPPAPDGPVVERLAGRRASLRRPALIGAAALGLLVLLASSRRHSHTLALSTTHALPVTSEPGIEFEPALSPDGGLLAFARLEGDRFTLGMRSVALSPGGRDIALAPDTAYDQLLPAWDGSGERVRYVSRRRTQGPASPAGSPPAWRAVARLGGSAHDVPLLRATPWAAWTRDDARVVFAVGDSIFIADSAGARTRLLAVHEGGWSPHSFAWSPDERWIAYVDGNPFWPVGFNTAPSRIWLVASDGRTRVPVTDGGRLNVSPAWLDDAHLLFVSDRDGQREVYAIELDRAGTVRAQVTVPGGTDAHSIAVSADGRRLAVARSRDVQVARAYDLRGRAPLGARDGRIVTPGTQVVETHDVSPDGSWLAYDTNIDGDADIYLVRTGGGERVPIVTSPAPDYSPRFSPDGREIAYYGGEGGGIWVVGIHGGVPLRLDDGGDAQLPIWAPDGRSIVFRAARTGRFEAWIVTRDRVGGAWSAARRLTDFGCAYQAWAADGSGVICGSAEQGTVLTGVARSGAVLWRRDFAAAQLGRMRFVALSPDGADVYMGGTRGRDTGIWAVPLAGGPPRLVVRSDAPELVVHSYPGTITVTRDVLYLTVGAFESDIWVMDLVRP